LNLGGSGCADTTFDENIEKPSSEPIPIVEDIPGKMFKKMKLFAILDI